MSSPLSPEDRQRLETLFERAAELPHTEHQAFVERECGPSGALREHLERLLQGAAAKDVLGEARPGAPVAAGTRIGPYKLLEKIGEGGMGEVYAAEQTEPVKRRVALKIIKPGMGSAQVVARFEAERQALARMSHSNVAQVYDGGTTADGRPYFVMEYVAGTPITDYSDRRKLSTRERIELFLAVCDGVQHAHQKGLIHRDLKPSNLLVTEQDGRPVPKIIDFGIARATTGSLAESTLHTMIGQIIGTLDYMSPEQADPTAVDIDTRSDIYSLGVVLYQLVSGLLPFDHASTSGLALAEVQRAIREQDPPTPSTRLKRQTGTATTIAPLHGTDDRSLVRQLAGDLDWITLKALEKDPARRYPSASELAMDLRRHLADEPVLAGRPGALYRARKYVRRHRVGVTAGVLVAAAAIAGIFGIVSGRIVARALEPQGAWYKAGILLDQVEDLWPPHPAMIPALESWRVGAGGMLASLPGRRAALAGMPEAQPPVTEQRWNWRFPSDVSGSSRSLQSALVGRLEEVERIAAPDAFDPDFGWSVPKRLSMAERLRDGLADGGEWDERWKEAIQAIGRSEDYGGLALAKQAGLVPIGEDPFSHLWEFWHVPSGEEPVRVDGLLVLKAETGMVFVLIPEGTYWMGAQTDPAGPNYDPMSGPKPGEQALEQDKETGMPVEVPVPAFFLSKYEMTQGQWTRLRGSNPSVDDRNGDTRFDEPDDSPLRPVNNVSATECDTTAARFGLVLPHEEQWEYAARAGTTTPWPTGEEASSLEGFANIAEGLEDPATGRPPMKHTVNVDANYPNAWGLHGMLGNVSEWCSNRPYDYGEGGDVAPAFRRLRSIRGGSCGMLAKGARSARRINNTEDSQLPVLGLRPARAVVLE